MARNHREVAHTRTDMDKYKPNYDAIDWSKKMKDRKEQTKEEKEYDTRRDEKKK